MKLKHFNLEIGSQIFKSLSDTTRIRILYLLYKNKALCISDLEMILDSSQSKISRHLAYLKNTNLVFLKKIDQWSFYGIKEEIMDLVEHIFTYLGKDADLLNDQKRYEVFFADKHLAIHKLEEKDRNFFRTWHNNRKF